jgi:hypothetical protein
MTAWSSFVSSTSSPRPPAFRRLSGHCGLQCGALLRAWACRPPLLRSCGSSNQLMGVFWAYWVYLETLHAVGWLAVGAGVCIFGHFGRLLLGQRWIVLGFLYYGFGGRLIWALRFGRLYTNYREFLGYCLRQRMWQFELPRRPWSPWCRLRHSLLWGILGYNFGGLFLGNVGGALVPYGMQSFGWFGSYWHRRGWNPSAMSCAQPEQGRSAALCTSLLREPLPAPPSMTAAGTVPAQSSSLLSPLPGASPSRQSQRWPLNQPGPVPGTLLAVQPLFLQPVAAPLLRQCGPPFRLPLPHQYGPPSTQYQLRCRLQPQQHFLPCRPHPLLALLPSLVRAEPGPVAVEAVQLAFHMVHLLLGFLVLRVVPWRIGCLLYHPRWRNYCKSFGRYAGKMLTFVDNWQRPLGWFNINLMLWPPLFWHHFRCPRPPLP